MNQSIELTSLERARIKICRRRHHFIQPAHHRLRAARAFLHKNQTNTQVRFGPPTTRLLTYTCVLFCVECVGNVNLPEKGWKNWMELIDLILHHKATFWSALNRQLTICTFSKQQNKWTLCHNFNVKAEKKEMIQTKVTFGGMKEGGGGRIFSFSFSLCWVSSWFWRRALLDWISHFSVFLLNLLFYLLKTFFSSISLFSSKIMSALWVQWSGENN